MTVPVLGGWLFSTETLHGYPLSPTNDGLSNYISCTKFRSKCKGERVYHQYRTHQCHPQRNISADNWCHRINTEHITCITLHWRHNDHGGVSNHQLHCCLLNRLFRRRSNKTSKLRVTGLCAGSSPGPVNSPHKGPVTRKMFPFDDVIMRIQTRGSSIWHHVHKC